MSLNDWHRVFVFVCIMLVLLACAPMVTALLPNREEPYFALALLGKEGRAEHYYPGDNNSIGVGDIVNWTIYLYNHIEETRYVAIRVKLLNSSMLAPNSSLCNPTVAPVVYEVRQVIMNNQTLLLAFYWSIIKVEQIDDFLDVQFVSVNGDSIYTHVVAPYGFNYRVVFELWVYDEAVGDFRFGWGNDDEARCVWNQIWFNVTLSK